ncbi:MAG: electron transport complex subunit RsxG [Pseudomonadota bacterium]
MNSALRNGLTLAVIAGICTSLVAGTFYVTQQRIEENRQAWLERSLKPALAGLMYDSDVTESVVVLEPPHALPGNERALIYRVYSGSEPVAALFVVSARDGYSGPIRVLVGIDLDGRVSGVRILEHRETPGLGDGIEHDKSDWDRQFTGRSLRDPETGDWAIRRDGGVFDQLSGASVTPRAVITAVRDTLIWFEANREQVFAMQETGL